MKNETIKKWLKRNGFQYTAGQWRQMIDGGEMGLLTCEAAMNVLGGRGFGRRSADAVVNLYHRAEDSETRDFLKKMGVIGFYQGVEYLPVFDDAPAFPIHDFYIEGHLSKILRGKIDRFEKSAKEIKEARMRELYPSDFRPKTIKLDPEFCESIRKLTKKEEV